MRRWGRCPGGGGTRRGALRSVPAAQAERFEEVMRAHLAQSGAPLPPPLPPAARPKPDSSLRRRQVTAQAPVPQST